MVALAESEPSIAIVADDLDADPWKLNVANGTVDLRSGELRRHDPAELHTKIAGAAYNAGATAPLWEKILAEILPDAEVRAFVQRYMGYCLTGSVREQCLAFLWGAGSNGKTTFLEAIREAMGDCAHQAGGDLLVAKRERGAGDMAAVASLRGRRLVTTIEVDDSVRLAEGLVKELTGERRVTAKLMRRDPIEFENVSKLCLAANHKPEVRGQDYAMWRRIKLIPFDVTIPDERKDADLGPKLAQERDGILGWLVEGCLAYQREGLREPAVIKAATAEYRDESNQLRDWLDECTEAVAGASTPTAQLRDDYISWAERERIRAPLKPTKFGTALTDAGFPGGKSNGVRVRHGIRLTRGGDRGGLAV
jgi:putative DNA primase/helicase